MVLLEIIQGPSSLWAATTQLMLFAAPLWIAVLVGILVGWSWKPRWVAHLNPADFSLSQKVSTNSSSSVPGTVLQHLSGSIPSFKLSSDKHNSLHLPSTSTSSSSISSSSNVEKSTAIVNEDDLKHICLLSEEKDGGPAWIQMMNRSTDNMTYEAWRRDPETGPPQYRSRTVYENATPEIVRDFFWDDEFRLKWDDMLLHAETLEDCPTTGTMVVQWVRKFPFFCSDREYIIGRRIWRSGNTYFCVTKGVPNSRIPLRQKPRRVDLYYSSWCIRPAESKRDGQLTACEVLLFHHEDMGIPWEIAKLGVRQGMWGAVKKIYPALRVYQKQRASGVALSRSALLAQINSEVSMDYMRWLESTSSPSEFEALSSPEKPSGRSLPRYLVVGGAIALACTLDRGLLTKAVIFGVARRFAKMGKRL